MICMHLERVALKVGEHLLRPTCRLRSWIIGGTNNVTVEHHCLWSIPLMTLRRVFREQEPR